MYIGCDSVGFLVWVLALKRVRDGYRVFSWWRGSSKSPPPALGQLGLLRPIAHSRGEACEFPGWDLRKLAASAFSLWECLLWEKPVAT